MSRIDYIPVANGMNITHVGSTADPTRLPFYCTPPPLYLEYLRITSCVICLSPQHFSVFQIFFKQSLSASIDDQYPENKEILSELV